MWAYRNDSKDIVQMIINHSKGILHLDPKALSEGVTPLMVACYLGLKYDVNLLLYTNVCKFGFPGVQYQSYHSNINAKDTLGWTAFMIACHSGHKDIVQMLLNQPGYTIDLNSTRGHSGKTAFMMASEKGHTDVVKLFFEHSEVNWNIKSDVGKTALMMACIEGHKDIVQLFLNYLEIDLNAKSDSGRTAFMYACFYGHIDVVKLFINSDLLEPNITDIHGSTGLMLACQEGHTDIVQILLQFCTLQDNGLDNKDNCHALLIKACCKGQTDVVKLLLDYLDRDIILNTMMNACLQGDTNMVELLLEQSNVDPNATKTLYLPSTGTALHTPFTVASIYKRKRIVKIFLRYSKAKGIDLIIPDQYPENIHKLILEYKVK